MKEENIGVLSAGERFGFKGFEWIVLDNNVDGGVLAIMAFMMVTKATSSTFTVSKPFFTLSFYDGRQTYEDTFSMYDIENAPTTVSADEITIDGSASSIAEFSNYLGTKSVDGSLKVTWSLGNHSYSKTVKNVYSTSYVIPVSWLDAISDSSQAYGGGKVGS